MNQVDKEVRIQQRISEIYAKMFKELQDKHLPQTRITPQIEANVIKQATQEIEQESRGNK